jgi:hypothetical protein
MIEDIKLDLAENFREGEEQVLQDFIDEATTDALSISNRKRSNKNIELLSSDIKKCVKSMYLLRGSEGTVSNNDDGKTASFENPKEIMRIEIVKSGKRVPFL